MRRITSESKMSSRTMEAQRVLLDLAGDGRAKDRMNRAYRALSKSFTWNRVRDIFHADPRISIRDDEMAALVAATKRQQADQEARNARVEYHEILDRLSRLEAALSVQDAEFHREAIDQAGASVRGLGGAGRSVDSIDE